MKLRGLVPNFYIDVSVSDFIYSNDRSAYFTVLRLRTDLWEYINLSQILECRNLGKASLATTGREERPREREGVSHYSALLECREWGRSHFRQKNKRGLLE
jgi:hypothetical protein